MATGPVGATCDLVTQQWVLTGLACLLDVELVCYMEEVGVDELEGLGGHALGPGGGVEDQLDPALAALGAQVVLQGAPDLALPEEGAVHELVQQRFLHRHFVRNYYNWPRAVPTHSTPGNNIQKITLSRASMKYPQRTWPTLLFSTASSIASSSFLMGTPSGMSLFVNSAVMACTSLELTGY